MGHRRLQGLQPGSGRVAPDPKPRTVATALILAVAAMSSAAILVRLVHDAGPLAIAFYRLAIASLVLAPWVLIRYPAELRALTAKQLAVLGAIGVVLGLHFAAWITSLGLTTVASSVVLVTMHPAIVGVLSLVWLKEGPSARGWAGIAVALGGAAVLLGGDFALSGTAIIGDGLAFAGAVFAALYFLGGRRQRQRHSLPVYALVVYASAALTLLVLALARGDRLSGFAPQDYALMLALALGPQLAGHTVANWSLRWLPAAVVSTAIVGEPVGSTLLALVVLGEAPPALSLLGGALILAGVYFVATGQARNPRAAATAPMD